MGLHQRRHNEKDLSFEIINNGSEEAELVMLQGKPINEKVVQHGPFVMNSQREIQEAFDDYRKTQFGEWPFDSDGPVHDRALGRFARYFDGHEQFR